MTILKSRYIFSFLVIAMLCIQPVQSSEVETVIFPEFKTTSSQFEADSKNDLFIQSASYIRQNQHQFTTDNPVNRYEYSGQSLLFYGMHDQDDLISTTHPRLIEFQNTTNVRTMVDFRTSYYSLFSGDSSEVVSDGNDDDTDQNIRLDSGKEYGFILNVEELNPLFLRLVVENFVSSITVEDFTVTIVDPQGTVTSARFRVSQHVEDLIPVVPKMTGEHYVFIRPDVSVILKEVTIVNEPEVEVIENGVSESITGEQTVGKFFRVRPDINPQVFHLDSFITPNLYLGGLPYLGALSIRIFAPGQTNQLLGSSLTSMSIVGNKPIYISVVAVPPDESDPAVAAAKADGNLEEGMDLDYSITVERRNVGVLPLNQPFWAFDTQGVSSSWQYYRIVMDRDTFMSYNTSSGSTLFATFSPQEMGRETILVDSSNNNLIDGALFSSDDAAIIPSGLYIVAVRANYRHQFTTFQVGTLEMESTTTSELGETGSALYHAGSEGYVQNMFNISVTNDNFVNSYMRVRTFDYDGTATGSYLLNQTNFNATSGQTTLETDTITTQATFDHNYLLIEIVEASMYFQNGTLATNNTMPTTVKLNVTRSDRLTDLNENTNGSSYVRANLADSLSYPLNVSGIQFNGYFSINTAENSAYRITVDSFNHSIQQAILRYSTNLPWIFSGQSTPTLVNNQTHYILDVSFATTEARTFGFFINLATTSSDANVTLSLEKLSIQQLPGLDLEVITIGGDDGEGDGLSAVAIGGIIAVVGVLVVGGLLVRRRFF